VPNSVTAIELEARFFWNDLVRRYLQHQKIAGLPEFSWYNKPKCKKVYQHDHNNTKWTYNIPKWQYKFQMAMK
jgi:hypothetical protein